MWLRQPLALSSQLAAHTGAGMQRDAETGRTKRTEEGDGQTARAAKEGRGRNDLYARAGVCMRARVCVHEGVRARACVCARVCVSVWTSPVGSAFRREDLPPCWARIAVNGSEYIGAASYNCQSASLYTRRARRERVMTLHSHITAFIHYWPSTALRLAIR